jgi:hypothetical protein
MYEDKIAARWSDTYQGDPLAIRTITKIRSLAIDYANSYKYDFVILDTSPSLGALNKVVVSTVDGFIIPCFPDMFSLYGIRNVGNSLIHWKKQFNTIYTLISEEKRNRFPENFVRFLGFTIYNAKKFEGITKWDLAKAAYYYAEKIPPTIEEFIRADIREHLTKDMINEPIGGTAVMHTHNTLPTMAQKYKNPIWKVPSLLELEPGDINTIKGNRSIYERTKNKYIEFAQDLLTRISYLDKYE